MPAIYDRETMLSRLPSREERGERRYNIGDEVVIVGDWPEFFGRTVTIDRVQEWNGWDGDVQYYYGFEGNTYTEIDEDFEDEEEEFTIELYSDDVVTPEEWHKANSTSGVPRKGITGFWKKVA